jgi:hypothetical protein
MLVTPLRFRGARITTKRLQKLDTAIRSLVPVGRARHTTP